VSTALEKLKQAIEEQQKLNSLFTKVIARFLFLLSNPEMGTIYNREARAREGRRVVISSIDEPVLLISRLFAFSSPKKQS
jgi:hypothetical protein